jgi:hypothetical protein
VQEDLAQALIIWCDHQQRVYEHMLTLMESKAMWTVELREGKPQDTTAESILKVKEMLEELERLLSRYSVETEAEDDLSPP